ncbi:MAG: hypothetical protein AUH39_04415 [Chloroflexi bacterium 13_1_40CM_67_9]|nr:MAG: hypothetical protein AUH39_04415 [Chloroflexi bacterium 13_1_40CM_67_9]
MTDRGEELALQPVRAFKLQVVHAQLANEVGVLVRDGHQAGDRAQCPGLGVRELTLIVEVRRQKADGAAARRKRNVCDESQLAGRNPREADAVGVRLGANEHTHCERDCGRRLDADGRRCVQPSARARRRPRRVLANDDRAGVRIQKGHHAIE